jgi:hypothetical protein
MENQIISSLQLYKKPDKDFLKDKDCLICFETIDLEAGKIVKLPCGCANSVYHISCIVRLLGSGENKNFCPHCRGKYDITLQQTVPVNNINNITNVVTINAANIIRPEINSRTQMLSYIMLVHILSNSVMNIINIGMSSDYPDNKSADVVSKMLLISFFCKILINTGIIISLKAHIDKLESYLCLSYTIQSFIFIFLVCLVSMIKNDFKSVIMLLNNIFFGLTDFGFRVALEYKRINRIDIER